MYIYSMLDALALLFCHISPANACFFRERDMGPYMHASLRCIDIYDVYTHPHRRYLMRSGSGMHELQNTFL